MNEEYYDEFAHKTVRAENLPEGWFWEKYNDGSGYLHSSNDVMHFAYDCSSDKRGIEYEELIDEKVNLFVGDIDDYIEFAEERIAKQLGLEIQSKDDCEIFL